MRMPLLDNKHHKVKDLYSGDFPGGSVVKTLCFHCRGHGFDPWWGDLNILCGIAKKIFFNSVCLFQTYGVTSTTNRPQLTYFIFLGFKITADSDCSHEIKRHLLLGRKAMANLENVLKSRNITFPTKVYIVKAMVFPVVMYGCESWTIKKAECWRIDVFQLW